jgi:hypothetical protein
MVPSAGRNSHGGAVGPTLSHASTIPATHCTQSVPPAKRPARHRGATVADDGLPQKVHCAPVPGQ